jgi:L-malate glycosyltransferase
MKRIVAVHLLNDRSGSPFVFRQALEALQQKGYAITLYTATPNGEGFLSGMAGIEEQELSYRHKKNKLITLVYFLLAQWAMFWKLVRSLRKHDTVYVNTLLPMGAALAGWIRGCLVVYHIHEISINPASLRWLLKGVARLTAGEIIFVSHYVESKMHFRKKKCHVVYNALSPAFLEAAARIQAPNIKPRFTVLMLCSLKAYKGIYSFLEVCRLLPDMSFELVLNASADDTASFRRAENIPVNCQVFGSTSNTLPFFQRAHVVMNLSNPEGWIETFGLTLLEAMACGRPAIAPEIGGPTELVTHGLEGYCVDGRRPEIVAAMLQSLHGDFRTYVRFSENARKKALSFGKEHFENGIAEVFGQSTDANGEANFGQSFQKMEFAA